MRQRYGHQFFRKDGTSANCILTFLVGYAAFFQLNGHGLDWGVPLSCVFRHRR